MKPDDVRVLLIAFCLLMLGGSAVLLGIGGSAAIALPLMASAMALMAVALATKGQKNG